MAKEARWLCGLLALFWTVLSVVAQDAGCGSLRTQYVFSNLGNLSRGLSNIQQLRDLALRPLLKQPRVPGTAGSRLARTHIKTWMAAQGWTVEEDSFWDLTPYGYRAFSNIITTLNPGRPRRVILACHYDTKMLPGIRFVGAIDSAVPCSLLMDSAFRLKNFFQATKNTNSSDLTLQFVFFDGEESFSRWTDQDSLYGSRHLANLWASPPGAGQNPRQYTNQGIDTLILLDLIGTSDTHFKLRYWETASVYNKLYAIESCLQVNGLLTPTVNQRRLFTSQQDLAGIEDDHLPFLHRGVPVVHLITSPFPWVWHTAYDDLPYMDFDRIDNLARILRIFLVDLPL